MKIWLQNLLFSLTLREQRRKWRHLELIDLSNDEVRDVIFNSIIYSWFVNENPGSLDAMVVGFYCEVKL